VQRPAPAQATLVPSEHGLEPAGEGWFVVNAADTVWRHLEEYGDWCTFEGTGAARFKEVGINLHVLEPGQPNCKYHGESGQEGFLVLSGACIVVIDGEERHLHAWDFVHCPSGTEHVFVGAGDGPCLLLMVGARPESGGVSYPVSEAAARHGASVSVATPEPQVAYAGTSPRIEIPARRDVLPGAPR
jgi:uncharacterized cupin superfamily protein